MIVNVFRRVVEPIKPVVVMLPVPAFNVRFWVPLTVPLIVMVPAPGPLFSVVAAARVIGPLKPMAELFVSTLPPMVTGPVPD